MGEIKSIITRYLEAYIRNSEARFAVMIAGKWGSGKTYFIKNLIESWKSPINAGEDDSIALKPIYVSLSSVSSPSGLYNAIWKEVFPILNTTGASILKNIFGGAIKIISRNFIDLNGDGQSDNISGAIDIETFIKLFLENERIIGNRVLVFDDLERCSLTNKQLFGILNQFTEHSDCRVILIANEDRLANKDNQQTDYKEIKEKLIGHTFRFDSDVSDAVKEIVEAQKDAFYSSHLDLIEDIFSAAGHQNLRSLKKALQSFSLFCDLIDKKYRKDKNVFDDFQRNVLAYFLICSFEINAGNNSIKDYQGFAHFFKDRQEAKENDKYADCLSKYGIHISGYSIPISSIYQFLVEGYISDLERILNQCAFFKSASQKDWEYLWSHSNLENDVFLKYVTSVRGNLSSGTITNIPTLLHSVGILISLHNSKLIRLRKRDLIIDGKRTARKIFRAAENPSDNTIQFSHESAYGKGYAGENTPEFIELTSYCYKLKKEHQHKFTELVCQSFWEELNDNNVDQITRLVHQRHVVLGSNGLDSNIFSGVNLRVATDRIIELSNAAKVDLWNVFFSYQGHYSISDEEKQSMRQLTVLLRQKANGLKLVDKETVFSLAAEIEKCFA